MPSAWGAQSGWQRFAIAWYLTWPGWVLGWLIWVSLGTLGVVSVDFRISTAIILTSVAVGQFVRLFSLHLKRFERFRVAIVRNDSTAPTSIRVYEALAVSAMSFALLALVSVAIYALFAWINFPQFSPQSMLAAHLGNPWMWSTYVVHVIDRKSNSFQIEMIPAERVP